MTVETIPIIKLTKTLSTFSYRMPKELEGLIEVGQIVDVNFHGRDIQALVTDIQKTKPKQKLKKINGITFPFPLATKEQIEIIFETAEQYICSPSIIAKTMLPQVPKRQKKYLEYFENSKPSRKIKPKEKNKAEFIWYNQETEKTSFYQKKIDSTKSGQMLFVVPEISQIDQLISKLDLKKKDYLVVDSKISAGKFFDLWCKLINQENLTIFGTKMSVFLPWTNLRYIFLEESQNWNHKSSEQNPRYDARKIADLVSQKSEAKLIQSSPAPAVESYQENKLQNKKAGDGKTAQLKIVNLKDEETKGNYTFLSDDFWYLARAYILQKKQVVVLHNRKGLAGYVHCSKCGFVFNCPDCDVSLVYYQKTGRLHCHQCDHSQEMPPFCPKCSGSEIKFNSKGTEDIVSKVQNEFRTYKVAEADKKNIDDINNFDKYQIVVGTQFVLSKIDWTKVGLLFFSNIDQFLVSPDFRSPEKIFQILSGAFSKLDLESHLIIQTYQPQNTFLKAIESHDPKDFYKHELANRKKLSYPPFVRLIKIFFKDKSQSRAYFLSDKLVKELQKQDLSCEIKGPIPAYPRKIRDKFVYNIVLKVKDSDFRETAQKLKELVPPDFVIDVDPERII